MIPVKLMHNPNAGDGDHSKKELIKLLEEAGYECRYSSTKEDGWDKIEEDTELIILAGGDGTVRKVAKKMLQRKLIDKQVPLALLPAGTANNIAKTLDIPVEPADAIRVMQKQNLKLFDAGKISGLEEVAFFMESFGIGLFPRVMKEMDKRKDEQSDDPQENIQMALEVFYELLQDYEAQDVKITADDEDYSGKYLLAEVMNTSSIGPNLVLAPNADPGDGSFELVLIPEDDREHFAEYLQQRIAGKDVPLAYKTISARKVTITAAGTLAHADDELLKLKDEAEINIEMLEGVLQFLVK